MRKSLRLFLVLAMACMMSLSFFFAGSLLAKADGSVDFAATEGASIYFAGDGNDLGINYQIKLNKQDFDTLKALTENEGKTIAFGGVYGYAYGEVDEITVETGKIVISNTDGVFDSLDEDYYVYDVELLFDTDAMYEEDMANADPEDVITLSEYKAQLITMSWVVKPFYAVYEGDFDASAVQPVYGEASSARMMVAVAAAIEAAGEDTPYDFKDKYSYNTSVTDYVVTLDAEGNFGGDAEAFTENTVAFIVGDNAELFTYQDGQYMASCSTKTVAEIVSKGGTTISTFEVINGSINVYRHAFAYAEESVDSIAIDANGKMHINKLDTTGKQIVSAYVDGVDVLKEDGTLDLALAGKGVGDKFLLVLANETSNLFAITNAEVYDQVFENTAESRKALVATLKGGASGCYALAENLYFDGTDEEERFDATDSSTFSGVFDGYGYTMFDITIVGTPGIFGNNAGICTLKNFAIKGISMLNDYSAVFFKYAPAGSEVTVENVYIYRYVTESKDTNSIFVYGPSSGSYGTWYMSNVIVEQEFASGLSARKNDIFSTAAVTDIAGEFADVYFLANGGNKGAESADGNLKNYRIPEATATSTNATLADSRAQMIEAGNNYDNFSEDYWIIDTDGLPAWINCYTDAVLVDAEGGLVTSTSFSTVGEEYSVVACYNGALVEVTLAKAQESELISISGNVITIGTGTGSVVVNASYNGTVIGSFTFHVDTRTFEEVSNEVIVSKTSGKAFSLDEIEELEGKTITDVVYNGASVWSGNNIITTTNLAVSETPCEFRVTTSDNGFYILTNVKVYTEVFEDTAESRKALVTTLKGGASGSYALAEDLHFVGTDSEEQFNATDSSTFSGVFNGRGHTMFDITIAGTPGIFGTNAGICTLKNFAIKGISTLSDFNGVFFRYAPAGSEVTVENVYIYRYVETSKNTNSIFVYGPSKVDSSYGTWYMSNVIVEQEFDSTLATKQNDIFSTQAVTGIAGEFADVYFITNGGDKGATSADGNLKYYRLTAADATLADARAQMINAGNNYDTFSSDYWTTDADGLPAWKTLQTTAE